MAEKSITRGVSPTALRKLRLELGTDSILLKLFPIKDVEIEEVQEKNFERYLGHKINLGVIWRDSKCLTLWAYATREARQHGMPEINIYGLEPVGVSIHYYGIHAVIEKADFREVFKLIDRKKTSLTIVLKMCFILKNAEFPHDIELTKAFLEVVCRVCRAHTNDKPIGNTLPETRDDTTLTQVDFSNVSTRPKASMRKSEQRGPQYQQFGPLASALQTPPRDASTPAPAMFSPESEYTSKHGDSVLSRSMSISPAPACTIAVAKMLSTAASETTIRPLPPPFLSSILTVKPPTGRFPVSTPTPARDSSVHINKPRPLDIYFKLRDQKEVIDDELTVLDLDIKQHDQTFDKHLLEKKTYRGNELPHVHRLQREKFLAQQEVDRAEFLAKQKTDQEVFLAEQKTEAQRLKEEYLQMKQERDEKRKPLVDQRQFKIEAMQEVEENMMRQKNTLSMDQLLDGFYAAQSASKKRKREDDVDDERKQVD